MLVKLYIYVAIRFLQRAHKAIPGTDDTPFHEFAEDLCSHIQWLDLLRETYGPGYRRRSGK